MARPYEGYVDDDRDRKHCTPSYPHLHLALVCMRVEGGVPYNSRCEKVPRILFLFAAYGTAGMFLDVHETKIKEGHTTTYFILKKANPYKHPAYPVLINAAVLLIIGLPASLAPWLSGISIVPEATRRREILLGESSMGIDVHILCYF